MSGNASGGGTLPPPVAPTGACAGVLRGRRNRRLGASDRAATLGAMTRWLMLALLAASAPAMADRVIDLSHAYDADTIYWPTESGFVLEKEHEGVTPKG